MANRRRRTQWLDTLVTDRTSLAAATTVDLIIGAEADAENLGGGVTITRIVGVLSLALSAAGSGTFNGAIWLAENFSGAAFFPTTWAADEFQRTVVMHSIFESMDFADDTKQHMFDIRTQRKWGQGRQLMLSFRNNAAVAGTYAFHTRVLVKLP